MENSEDWIIDDFCEYAKELKKALKEEKEGEIDGLSAQQNPER